MSRKFLQTILGYSRREAQTLHQTIKMFIRNQIDLRFGQETSSDIATSLGITRASVYNVYNVYLFSKCREGGQ